MTPRVVIAALAILLLSAHIAAAQPATPIEPGMGVLEGTVTRGPTAPVARPGVPNEAPVADAKIQIADPSGNVVTTTVSGSDGSYSVQLLRGAYLVRVVSPRPPFGPRAPEAVTISSGQRTHLDLQIDTGIR
jgi:Carboxypeptidase regulatory-like domain